MSLTSRSVLLVGAGGIGCEVVKLLCHVPCRRVAIVDLDTVDVSNLNRQFLFSPTDVGAPKAAACARALSAAQPATVVEPLVTDVTSPSFNVASVSQFDIAINALDNVTARARVNDLCVAAHVSLIDAGTAGLEGNILSIIPGVTACFACYPKPTPARPPVCSVRAIPSKPHHAVAWAKQVFARAFAAHEGQVDGTAGSILAELNLAPTAAHRASLGHVDACNHRRLLLADAHRAYELLFVTDVLASAAARASTPEVWQYGPPRPLPLQAPATDAAPAPVSSPTHAHMVSAQSDDSGLAAAWPMPSLPSLHDAWDTTQCQRVFISTYCSLAAEISIANPPSGATAHRQLEFHRSHPASMAFVAASATLRCIGHGIPCPSPFELQGIAGAIVPAVATTNATCAGLAIRAAMAALANPPAPFDAFISPVRGSSVNPVSRAVCDKPVATCPVCGSARVIITLRSFASTPLSLFFAALEQAGFSDPDVSANGRLLYTGTADDSGWGSETSEAGDPSANHGPPSLLSSLVHSAHDTLFAQSDDGCSAFVHFIEDPAMVPGKDMMVRGRPAKPAATTASANTEDSASDSPLESDSDVQCL
jgi:ubiquitin-like 1-activating enzyme E1 B